jgi:hypothetical protein
MQSSAGSRSGVNETGIKTWHCCIARSPIPRGCSVRGLRRLTLGRYPDLDLKAARKRAAIRTRPKSARGLGIPRAAKQEARRTAAARRVTRSPNLAKGTILPQILQKKQKRSWRDDERMLNVEVLPHWRTRKKSGELGRRDVRALIEAIADGDRRLRPTAASRADPNRC